MKFFFFLCPGTLRKRAVVLSAVLVALGGGNNPVASFFFAGAWAETTSAAPAPIIGTTSRAFSSDTAGVLVVEIPLQQKSPAAASLFTRRYGEELGLVTESNVPMGYKVVPPFQRSWPVASADIDGDGWIDLVFGTEKGVFLYRNVQGERFESLPLKIPGEVAWAINTALVDLNNDGLPDLYVSLYRHGNYIFFNKGGKFLAENLVKLPELGSSVLSATAFGDLDLDGDIDIAAGNWTAGPPTARPGEGSRNAILWQESTGYKVERLPGVPGETLSMLISDINQDGFPDLMVGNDFLIPDFYYLGRAGGKLEPIKRSDNIFPLVTYSTMSIDSGDMDNDLDLDIYATQASGFTSSRPTSRASMLPLKDIGVTCSEFEDNDWKTRCLTRTKYHQIVSDARQKRDPHLCLEIEEELERKACITYMLFEKSTRFNRNPGLCGQLEKNSSTLAYACKQAHKRAPRTGKRKSPDSLKQILGRNMLHVLTPEGSYEELGENMDIDITGWSWTAKFADLDNDEWQDLYVVNGRFGAQKRATKVFFRNQQGQHFSNDTIEAGLENYLAISSYTYIDYDNDADLDIVAVPHEGPIWVYTNNIQGNTGIIFELDDKIGNRAGIGGRIIIHYGDGGSKHQIREIKASGGFLSYDAPRAHFGLGEQMLVSRVEVTWSTGEKTELQGEFKAGHKYVIERSATGLKKQTP